MVRRRLCGGETGWVRRQARWGDCLRSSPGAGPTPLLSGRHRTVSGQAVQRFLPARCRSQSIPEAGRPAILTRIASDTLHTTYGVLREGRQDRSAIKCQRRVAVAYPCSIFTSHIVDGETLEDVEGLDLSSEAEAISYGELLCARLDTDARHAV